MSGLLPKDTGLSVIDELLLESARRELAYHMSQFQKSGSQWHRDKAKAYSAIVQSLKSKEADNASSR